VNFDVTWAGFHDRLSVNLDGAGVLAGPTGSCKLKTLRIRHQHIDEWTPIAQPP
jgi:hypothetical protein